MPRNTDGEFEVLLGNRQLLSVFFIVIILLAVFFTMGYVLGRSLGPSVVATRTPAPSPPVAVEKPASAPLAVATPPPAPPPPIVEEKPPKAQPKAEPKPVPPSGPASGQVYLQVAATKHPDAELVAGVLKKKGFTTLIAPGPTEAIFRVLVGPLDGPSQIASTRKELETAGFKPIVRKY
jgi:cell division protein FtsN